MRSLVQVTEQEARNMQVREEYDEETDSVTVLPQILPPDYRAATESPDISDTVEENESFGMIREAMGKLRANERRVVEMRHSIGYDKEYSISEIAEVMDLSDQRIRQLYNRGLRKISFPFEKKETDRVRNKENGYLDVNLIEEIMGDAADATYMRFAGAIAEHAQRKIPLLKRTHKVPNDNDALKLYKDALLLFQFSNRSNPWMDKGDKVRYIRQKLPDSFGMKSFKILETYLTEKGYIETPHDKQE